MREYQSKELLHAQKINSLIRQKKLTTKQKQILRALAKTKGIVAEAESLARFSRATHYRYMKEYPEYADAYEMICEATIDLAETSLLNQIVNQNTQATIFYLKTKGKHRGYVERQEVTHQVLTPKMIEIVKE